MKTIRFNNPAAWMVAGLATLMVAGTINAEEAGQVRLTDAGADSEAVDATSELVIRGASDLRRRNSQTSAALRQLFSDHEQQPGRRVGRPPVHRPIQQVSGQYRQPSPPVDCCPPEPCCPPNACCPPTCAAPCDCCPATCCAPPTCGTPEPCCPPACGCPPGQCTCAPSCGCPPGECCCPQPQGCCAPSCPCPPTCDGCCPNTCDGCAAVGQVRITDGCVLCGGEGCTACLDDTCCETGRCHRGRRHQGHCQHGHCQGGCPICDSSSCLNHNCFAGFMSEQAAAHRARNRLASANLGHYLRCKLGYFVPDGNGGIGSPMFGCYSIVYPVDAGYSDSRDAQVYAAQGYGGAMSVPLAPVVRQTYNYGWGIPSSRLTPVSNQVAP